MKPIKLIDTRPIEIFGQKYLKGSINIPLGEEFAYWLTLLVSNRESALFFCTQDTKEALILLLTNTGYTKAEVIAVDDLLELATDTESIESADSRDFNFLYESGEYTVIDLRRVKEVDYRFSRSIHLSLEHLPKFIDMFNPNTKYLIYCINGYRSMIACSILKANGIHNVYNLEHGIEEVKALLPEVLVYY